MSTHQPNIGFWSRGLSFFILIALLISSGCTPQKYIISADTEALCIIDSARNDSRWQIPDYRFLPEPDSRLYTNYYQEMPCQPGDDPASHRYMQCVDGYRGWRGWDQYGTEKQIDSMQWLKYMESENGTVIIDRNKAVELALKHSRDYQSAREGLYLSALSVSLQRFNLDVQPFYSFGSETRTDFEGYNTQNVSNKAGISKATAAGGTIMANIANSIVWTFGGDGGSHVSTTLFSYSLVQPLLQYAGRAYALENLTQAERNLLANVRQMERYRQGFYVSTVAGLGSPAAPSDGSTGIGNGRVSFGGVGGFYGLLKSQMELINQQANVDSLKDSLDRMQANCDSNRITSYQVDQTRQSLYQSQLSLLSKQNSYKNSVDQFKINLGLPPELQVEIRDPLLDSFELIDADLKALQKRTELTVVDIRSGTIKGAALRSRVESLTAETLELTEQVRHDVEALIDIAPRRKADLDQWASEKERWGNQMDLSIFDSRLFQQRVKNIARDAQTLFEQVQNCSSELQTKARLISGDSVPEGIDDDIYYYNGLLLELILVQGRSRLDSITLEPINMDSECAIEVARMHRLDWMNARAALVDQWRQIEIARNALKAGLQLTFDGSTTATDLSLGSGDTTSSMSLGVEFDAPLTRLRERNSYRRALISYYQAHRNFMAYEDNVRENIREILRKIDLCQMTFELQRASVLVSMSQYDQRRLQLERPPKPNETSSFGDSFARDLIEALDSLLSSQNQIMNDWLEYEAMRMALDYALGTMKIDENGLWLDPGSMADVCPANAARPTAAQPLPPTGEETDALPTPPSRPASIKEIIEAASPESAVENSILPPDTTEAAPENTPFELEPLQPEENQPEVQLEAAPEPYGIPNVTEANPSAAPERPRANPELLPAKSGAESQINLPIAPLPEE